MKIPDEVGVIGNAIFNNLFLKKQIAKLGVKEKQSFHFVLTHPDDELAFLPTLVEAHKNPLVKTGFSLVSNGTQGYEPPEEVDEGTLKNKRKEFGRLRESELDLSLRRTGYEGPQVRTLVDEREIYEALISDESQFGFHLHPLFDKIKGGILERLLEEEPTAVFVNDFSGGHIIHDISNVITCIAAAEYTRETSKYVAVLEYWQPLLDSTKGEPREEIEKQMKEYVEKGNTPEKLKQVIGELSRSNKGRKKIEGDPHERYPVDIPNLGIRKGVAFYGLFDVINTLRQKSKVYTSQGRSLNRLKALTEVSPRITRPRFRPINLGTINHLDRPENPILYELVSSWRQRGLERLPNFDDFSTAIKSYPEYQNFLQERTQYASN